jgi:hypothetical protein
MKHVGINLTKYVHDLDEENYRNMMIDIEALTRRHSVFMERNSKYCQGVFSS